MSEELDEACVLLDEFEKRVAGVKAIWDQLATDNPHFDVVSPEHWQEKYYRMWLHGAVDVWECNELERWLIDYPPSTALAISPAKEVYTAWRKWLLVVGPVKETRVTDYDKKSYSYVERESQEPTEAFYAEHGKFEIQEPQEGQKLYDFIVRLARSFEERYDEHQKCERKERKIGDWLEGRALKSFLDFIRKKYPIEQAAFIEHIFPKKMDLHYGRIIRLVPLEAYPIPEKTASEILIELARRSRNGRPDARHTALECFALCWLCIASSRIRLPITLEMLRDIEAEAVQSGAEFAISSKPTYGGKGFSPLLSDSDFSVLQVPTWFGVQSLKISNRMAAFFRAISCIPSDKPRKTILHKPRRSLDRMLAKALQAVNLKPEYGLITFLSLLNEPHFGDHRPQPKYSLADKS